MSDQSTKVNLDDFDSAIAAIPGAIQDMQIAMENAIKAGDRLKTAFGGEGTDIGAAVAANIVNVDKSTFDTTANEINDHLEKMKKISTAYREQKGIIQDTINKYSENVNTPQVQ